MTQTGFFGTDEPIAAASLPTNSNGLSWHNVQRQRLRKFAGQYLAQPPIPVVTLRSQGEPDVTIPAVVASRAGFTQLRRDLPVIDQYFEYGGEPDYLQKAKDICLAWARTNEPDGKPINESNFEWLLRVMKRRQADFSAAEWTSIEDWAQALRTAKEGFDFQTTEEEGAVAHGNWYTHHYKVLLQVYDLLGDTAAFDALLVEIEGFATRNFPFGNGAMSHPTGHEIVAASAAEGYFEIAGDRRAVFPDGAEFRVAGSGAGNDGAYGVAGTEYLSASDLTRIRPLQAVAADGGGGVLSEPWDEAVHDMPRPAVDAGESIDYVRRDALHYQVYDLAPWIEIALLAGRSFAQVDAGWDFFVAKLLASHKHYEFAASSDPFDAARWEASHAEYLAPGAMFKPQRAAGMMLAYFHHRRSLDPAWIEPAQLLAPCLRATDTISSFWAQYFRWALGYGSHA